MLSSTDSPSVHDTLGTFCVGSTTFVGLGIQILGSAQPDVNLLQAQGIATAYLAALQHRGIDPNVS